LKISIITVCYNSSSFIRSAIESVFNQSHSDIEYIIIDGRSNDGTIDIVNEYAGRIAHVVSESDKGIYDAMNKGITLATGNVIGILNSDDFYPHSEVIAEVVREMVQNPAADLVLGNVDFVYPDDLFKPVRFYSSFKFALWKMRFGFMPAHPGAFIKRSAYDKIGQYKIDYKIGADFDMFVRMLVVARLPYVKLNKTLMRMRVGGVSTSGIKSYAISTNEILRSLKENQIYSNVLMVLMRFPVKSYQLLLSKLRL
jgi:glycosyltransferase involved in cell wall biosynthesis